ncbi:hypothetical protein Glove_183g67 [Diversispora epigaea]|uniref:Serine-threonine/tyrosine-protein kinase catalytic domain-containing protein n=1 Tax=Diversispora epigaea TaxID=1348612 RepID=A0A397IMX4_9GLOM|nr:hypothetical protein Glove_183g67 [Diversispora epigaea]
MITHDIDYIDWNGKLNDAWDKTHYSLDTNIQKKILFDRIQKSSYISSSVEKQQCNNCLDRHQATQHSIWKDGCYDKWNSERQIFELYVKKSDAYRLGIIIWEVITDEIPFSDHEFNSDSDFFLAIINGYIPYEYETLMKQ